MTVEKIIEVVRSLTPEELATLKRLWEKLHTGPRDRDLIVLENRTIRRIRSDQPVVLGNAEEPQ